MEEHDPRLLRAVASVSARDRADFAREVLILWLSYGRSCASFAAYVEGEGFEDILLLAEKYRDVEANTGDCRNVEGFDAEHWLSSLIEGSGAASVGLLDQVEGDLNHAEALRGEWVPGVAAEQALYAIALCAARALLIICGIDATSDVSVFASFREHFILSGLIDRKFEPVVAAGEARDAFALVGMRDSVFALLDDVSALYKGLDDSFRLDSRNVPIN